jgi:F0F1-type ATP synthase membrane subunit b/b'
MARVCIRNQSFLSAETVGLTNNDEEYGMGKVLEFRRVKQEVKKPQEILLEMDDLEEAITEILNDYSLTPANRRWILENMLMDIDEQLEEYKRDLERAEKRLDKLVESAETDIVAAYAEFEAHVRGMTHAVEKLTTRRRPPRSEELLQN